MSSFTINSNVSNVAKLAKLKIQVLLWHYVWNTWNAHDYKTCPSNKHAIRKASHEYCNPLSSVVLPIVALTIYNWYKLTKRWRSVPNAEEFKYTPINAALNQPPKKLKGSAPGALLNLQCPKIHASETTRGPKAAVFMLTLFCHEKFHQCSFALQAMITYISHHHGQGGTVFRNWTTPLNYHCINRSTTWNTTTHTQYCNFYAGEKVKKFVP